jgi:hypothetical protein
MSKIFVIAGNYEQATRWMKENIKKRIAAGETTVSYSDYAVRANVDTLRGVANPHGVFVGTWKERKDLDETFLILLSHTVTSEQSHRTINRLYGEWMESQGRVVYK